jgi:prolyl-tRNA editing enzyme YbaK/EbsC (Cys-tRNA(Pro) deacylase)
MTQTKLQPIVQQTLEENNITYAVLDCDPELADTAAFCEHYGYSPTQAANTILVASKTEPVQYAACVALATTKLDVNKKVCQLLGIKRASFASATQTQELTGMMIGGVTIFGIANMPIYIDSAVLEQDEVIMGGGNRSNKVVLDPNELKKLGNVEIVAGLAQPREI